MDWMLFYTENNMQYYFFNGKWPVNVSPVGNEFWDREDDIDRVTLALHSRKTRIFIINKVRCIIVQRGIFKTEEHGTEGTESV